MNKIVGYKDAKMQDISGVSTRGTGGRVLQISGRGDSHAKVSTHFLIHNDAIAGFISQSLGLPAYACKTDSYKCNKIINSQNAPKLAILSSKNGKISGEGHSPLSRPLPGREGDIP